MRSARFFAILSLALAASAALFLMSPRPAQAGSAPFVESLSVLEDPTMSLTIADVISEKYDSKFTEVTSPYRSSNNDVAYWFKIKVNYPQGILNGDWVLDLNWNNLRGLDWHFPFHDGAKPILRGDSNLHVDSSVTLPMPRPGGEVVLFARLTSYTGLNLNPVIRSTDAEARTKELRKWLLGMFFGLLASMFVYNFFLLISLRDAGYLWYITHIFFISGYFLIFNGLGFFLKTQGGPEAFRHNLIYLNVIGMSMFACMGMFARVFLLTKKNHPVLNGFLLAQLAACGVYFSIMLIIGPERATRFGPYIGMITSVTIVIAGTGRALQGFKPARIFLAGWAIYVTCGCIHSLMWAGILPATPLLTLFATEFGSSIEVMVMALALAYRVKILRDEKALAERDRERLAQENALQSIILENSQLGIGLVQDGCITRSNRQLRIMAGRNDKPENIRLDEIPGFTDLLGHQTDYGSSGLREKEGIVGDAENKRTLRALGKMVDPFSPSSGAVWVVEDVTEQIRLEQLNKDLEHIFRHDLKSPLAAISMLNKAIPLSGPLNEGQKKHCRMIGEAVAWGLAQLNAALDIYKIESGAYAAELHPVELTAAVSEAISELAPYANGDEMTKKTVLDSGTQSGDVFVLGDETMLHAILVNLIKNALEAMPGPGEAILSISVDGQARLAITNPGEVPAAIRDRFFEKHATSGKEQGAGLGTYSARLMARALGGDVELDCSTPGQTTVTVRLVRAA